MSPRLRLPTVLLAAGLCLPPGPSRAAGDAPAGGPAPKKPPASNLDYWLNQGQAPPATTRPVRAEPANPLGRGGGFRRADALPGVIELSDGRQLPGGIYTTIEKPWIVWNQATRSWRRIPFVTVLSITAVVEEERMELRWRWKAMGEPERVYTGEKYPFRRLHWRFRLIDGSVVEGSTKGQPLWLEFRGKRYGPWVLHERMKGKDGQSLKDLLYVRRLVISRRMMDAVVRDIEASGAAGPQAPASKASPAGRPLPAGGR